MKILSWNVNCLRAALKNGILDFIHKESPDMILFQEIKVDKNSIPEEFHHMDYKLYINSAEKKRIQRYYGTGKKGSIKLYKRNREC